MAAKFGHAGAEAVQARTSRWVMLDIRASERLECFVTEHHLEHRVVVGQALDESRVIRLPVNLEAFERAEPSAGRNQAGCGRVVQQSRLTLGGGDGPKKII